MVYPRIFILTTTVLLAASFDLFAETVYQPQERHYFIAAEEVEWNYAPSGKNNIKPKMGLGEWGERLTYPKTRFIEYTDETFTVPKPQPVHLGILGPIIRGVVGDTLIVHFKNKGEKAYSVHPHGVFYDKANEGANYAGQSEKGGAVSPGETYTYTWEVTPEAGPGPEDLSSIVWLYHSHVDPVSDVYAGLLGALIITDSEHANADGTPNDVDRELVNLFMIFDENKHDEENEGDLMHSINGRHFGNLPGLEMNLGERVRWHLLGMGTEVDIHTPHWHGATVLHEGRRKDVVDLLAGTMTSADMVPHSAGTWLYHCHVTDHITAGMIALYTVMDSASD
ncbi:MAG: multicopper oxidase domain-containing protein [Candidatus Hydrogenedentes bacterium]|nr:multicopper oxidase domain-containing protein [Candidatus Hydrogenedentota bacterium]